MKRQRGFALIVTIVGMSLVLLTLLTALTITQYSGALIHRQLIYQGQALNAANAGVVEALDWFRRQSTQPVATFAPVRNLAAIPPINDTDEVTTPASIVRNFQISTVGNVWGRYEVHTGVASTGTGVLDLTANRGLTGAGTTWQLEAVGIVYVLNSTSVAYNVSPNVVLATKTVRSEIQRLAINLPANAAISTPEGDHVSIGTTGSLARVVGGTNFIGVAYSTGTSPNVGSGATLAGTPASSTGAGAFDIKSVFGSDFQTLGKIADVNVTQVSDLPLDATGAFAPNMEMCIINAGVGTAVTFDSSLPLRGSGILIVIGNLTISQPSAFNGIIYVNGNYRQTALVSNYGAVVAFGVLATPTPAGKDATVSIQGGGDYAEFYYDNFMKTQVQQQLGLYRFSRTPYVP